MSSSPLFPCLFSLFVFVSLSLSLSLSPFSGELGSRIVKRFIFIFRPWNLGQGRKIKMLLFSLTLSLRLEKRCCCQVVFILSLRDALDYKQDLIFVETLYMFTLDPSMFSLYPYPYTLTLIFLPCTLICLPFTLTLTPIPLPLYFYPLPFYLYPLPLPLPLYPYPYIFALYP